MQNRESIFIDMNKNDHEKVIYISDEKVNLKAIIAIHNTNLGPAIGGCRAVTYNSEKEALTDALRLSKAMSFKSALADLNYGGGKAVIILPPLVKVSKELVQAFAKKINKLNGLYITAADMGTNTQHMLWINKITKYVAGLDFSQKDFGDPAYTTAYGVLLGMKSLVNKLHGNDNLSNLKIVIQGVGKVGYYLCKELADRGVNLYVSDINSHNIKKVTQEFKVTVIDPKKIYSVDCDIFSPCAFGNILNNKTIPLLRTKIIAGAANNVLKDDIKDALMLRKRGILYVPDYVINSGGLYYATSLYEGGNKKEAMKKIENIYKTITNICDIADKKEITTSEVAYSLAKKKLGIN